MKSVRATIDALALDDVKERLRDVGATGMTIVGVQEFGRSRGMTIGYQGTVFAVDFTPRVSLELVVKDSLVRDVVETILRTSNSGCSSDEEISVAPVETAIRIRTGERDDDALS